jgi:hypothetical protein
MKETPPAKISLSFGNKSYPELLSDGLCMPSKHYADDLVRRYFEISTPFYRFLHQGTVESWIDTLYGYTAATKRPLSTGKIRIVLRMFAEVTLYAANPDLEGNNGDLRYGSCLVYVSLLNP